jgi:hypothetical protein
MSMDDQETAARFAAIMLRGWITEEQRYAEMQRVHPAPPDDPTNRLDRRHPDWGV